VEQKFLNRIDSLEHQKRILVPLEFDGGNRMETSAAKLQSSAGGPMATAEQTYLRSELERRYQRLQSALQSPSADTSLRSLLGEVDAALALMDAGTYGICKECHDPIEKDRLLSDPLVQVCLDHLTREDQRALENDLTLAARIQQALLPPADFATAGWQVRYHYAPASMVSGDYCDLLELNGGLLFLLGDVSGKGVAASMLMSHLHATFRSLADANLSLDRMVEAANRIFCESTMAGQFVTLVVGRASRDGSVEFVSAGHLPLLHLGTVGSVEPCAQGATGVPLGMFATARFPVARLTLAPGEALLIYTDGLTEARNSAGEEYGLHRVKTVAGRRRTAAPGSLISECLLDLRDFTAGAKQIDDLTLLAIQRAAA
jgi:sigma-B regulation protein RsbU (phosphoserine phosphatase)